MLVAVDDIKSLEASSGHGDSKVEQKTIVDEIRRVKHVGNGRFGRVWLGEWRGEKVAVKVFETKDTESWEHEKKIYHTNMLHHENILHCITCSSEPGEEATSVCARVYANPLHGLGTSGPLHGLRTSGPLHRLGTSGPFFNFLYLGIICAVWSS